MYEDLIQYPLRHPNLKWEAAEAVVDVHGRPHLFLRIKLTGTEFPVRAMIPQVWVGDVFARYVEIDQDRRTARAYFDRAPPREGELYFGHVGHAELAFGRYLPGRSAPLDRTRLPRHTVMPSWG